ncbi:MAG: UDP-N-acetylmuramyl-tripeptide synthetase [Alphaproteobacteria bacterium]|nr:UDP-N-acetylmuramyl-tripeptide synthetase [Alphaproteobacteria bacterium]
MGDGTARTLGALFEGLEVTWQRCGPETPVARVTLEPAEAGPGDLCVLQPRFHGDDFLPSPLPPAVLVTTPELPVPPEHPAVVLVGSTADMGVFADRYFGHPARRLRLAGITGTNGKTTTTWLVSAMLEAAGRVYTRMGTLGHRVAGKPSPLGFTSPFHFPLQTLLAQTVEAGGTDVIMEVSSHALAQQRLQPVQLDAVGMTNLAWDHIDCHGSHDAYRDAKLLLPQRHLKRDGVAVAFVDEQPACEAFLRLARAHGARAWRASRDPSSDAEIRVTRVREGSTPTRWLLDVETPCGLLPVVLPLEGTHNVENALVAIGLGLGLGLAPETIARGLAQASAPPGRMTWVSEPGPERVGVVVDYAHCPRSLEVAIGVARARASGRVKVVAGCGGDRDREKRPPTGQLLVRLADQLYATTDNPRFEAPTQIVDDMLSGLTPSQRAEVREIPDRREAIERAVAEAAPGDVILIAGKGGESVMLVRGQRLPFRDDDIALEALSQRP